MACPVCFGAAADPALRESMNAGIFVLLGVTAVVLACFLRFFVALARRSREAAHLVDSPQSERAAQMLEWLGMPPAGSSHAGDVDRLMVLVHWLMAALFVGWSTFFLYVLVRFRRASHPTALHHGMRGRWSTGIEGAVLAAEIILLAYFSIPAWSARVDAFPSEQQSTVVRVVAEQFAWNVHYPGPDRRFGRTELRLLGPSNPLGLDRSDPAAKDDITTINQLNVPVNRPVIVHLSSKDMVHSFALPQMRVKQDAIPGIAQPVWFTPTLTGQWEIPCSQLCGLGHYRMRGYYAVQSEADFNAWFAEETALNQP